MRYIFKFPDIGEGLTEGIVVEWYVDKGTAVKVGQPLVKMETDKVVTDIPSPREGVIAARYGKVGETVHVGETLVEIEIAGAEVPVVAPDVAGLAVAAVATASAASTATEGTGPEIEVVEE